MSSLNPLGWRLGTLRGVPIYVGRSWLLLTFIVVFTFSPLVTSYDPALANFSYVVAFGYALLLFISVLIHEASHALMGQFLDQEPKHIAVDLWGGHTVFNMEESTPGQAAALAAVGPIANAVLAGIGFGISTVVLPGNSVAELLIFAFTYANVFVAIFNALPALPLDGGFVLYALTWKLTGDRWKAYRIGGASGVVLAVLVFSYPFITWIRGHNPSTFQFIWGLVLAFFLWRGGRSAMIIGRVRGLMAQYTVADYSRPVQAIAPEATVADLPPSDAVVADEHGKYWGLIFCGKNMQVPLAMRSQVPASSLAEKISDPWVITVDDPQADISVLTKIFGNDRSQWALLIHSGTNEPWGLVHKRDVERSLQASQRRQA